MADAGARAGDKHSARGVHMVVLAEREVLHLRDRNAGCKNHESALDHRERLVFARRRGRRRGNAECDFLIF